jgi:hypothetical protein
VTRSAAEFTDEQRVQDSVMGGTGQFAPGDQLDVLLLKQLAEFGAGEEIEVALAPGGAPSVTLTRGGFHFVIVEGDVDNEFGDARMKVVQSSFVKLRPFFRRNRGRDGDGVVEDDMA